MYLSEIGTGRTSTAILLPYRSKYGAAQTMNRTARPCVAENE